MTPPAAKSPAPAPKLRLKWENDKRGTRRYECGDVYLSAFYSERNSTWKWMLIINTPNGESEDGDAKNCRAAQLAAEAAARELARNKILEALALAPDAIDEYLAAKAQGEEGEG